MNEKNITVFIKGNAIILMFCNHLYMVTDKVNSIAIGSKTIASYVGGFGKICVAVFAFLTGIGIYYIFQRKSYCENNVMRIKYSARKIFDILLVYWGILFLFYIPVAYLFGANNYTANDLLENILLVKTSIIQSAWYVRFYVELMITLPLIYHLLKETTKIKDGIILGVIVLFHLGAYLINATYIEEYFNYLMVVIIGFYFEKYSINVKVSNVFKKNILISIIALLLTVSCRGVFKSIYLINTDIIFAPILVGIIRDLYYKLIPCFRNIIIVLGKYSLELWFLHVIFFIGSERLQEIGYWPRIDFLILIWTLCIFLPIAMVYNGLFSRIKNLIFRIKVSR